MRVDGDAHLGGLDVVDPSLLTGGEDALRRNVEDNDAAAENELANAREALTKSYAETLKQAALRAAGRWKAFAEEQRRHEEEEEAEDVEGAAVDFGEEDGGAAEDRPEERGRDKKRHRVHGGGGVDPKIGGGLSKGQAILAKERAMHERDQMIRAELKVADVGALDGGRGRERVRHGQVDGIDRHGVGGLSRTEEALLVNTRVDS